MSELLLLAAVAIALVVCLNGNTLGERLGVMDHPDQHRKWHDRPTPQVGGMAILLGLIAWLSIRCYLGGQAEQSLLFAMLLCAAGVGLVGFEDDQHETSPLSRILLLLAFMGVAFAIDPQFIAHTLNWGSFNPTPIPLWAYLILMGVTVVGLVNAVNMADGQNGVVGSMFVVWSGCLMIVSNGLSAELAGVLFVTSLVFLGCNLWGKVFLGDCGSYGVTFALGLLVTLAHARGEVSLETVIVWFFIPVADCLRLLISRPLRGLSPFGADRDHFHHRLEDKLGKHQGLATYAAAVAVSSLVATLDPRFALVCLCGLSAFYFSFAWLTDATIVAASQPESGEDSTVAAASNVVTISGEGKDERKRHGAA
ncbi:MAG: MraY family glycosyltransferase [Rhizomicrobium sp.]|jgi:UDP-GlcNAc:undecaprenyl-phosphate GlcNAc-1-phosphate transferase